MVVATKFKLCELGATFALDTVPPKVKDKAAVIAKANCTETAPTNNEFHWMSYAKIPFRKHRLKLVCSSKEQFGIAVFYGVLEAEYEIVFHLNAHEAFAFKLEDRGHRLAEDLRMPFE
ncbi:MAG: hypothetical protein WB676_22315 [Bryobacteraceae bacterium]